MAEEEGAQEISVAEPAEPAVLGSQLANLPLPTTPYPAEEAIKLFNYFTSEFRGFINHMEKTVESFQVTGQVPQRPIYAKDPPPPRGEGKPRKNKKERKERKPTAFNHFVAEKIKMLKGQGVVIEDDKNNNELFKRAVAMWSSMTPDQKKEYGDSLKEADHEHDGDADGDGGVDDDQEQQHAPQLVASSHDAQLLMDSADRAAAEAPDAAGPKRKQGALDVLSAEHPNDTDHLSLTALVSGGEDAANGAAAVDAEEPGRKKRKGASTKARF